MLIVICPSIRDGRGFLSLSLCFEMHSRIGREDFTVPKRLTCFSQPHRVFFSDYISAAVILLQTACSSAHARGYKYMSFLLRLGRLKIFDK